MTVQIKLNDRQYDRLKKIQQAYAEHGLNFTLTETFEVVFRTRAKEYIDRELDRVEQMLFTEIRGRVKGAAWRGKE